MVSNDETEDRVQQTVSALPDDELRSMLRQGTAHYTSTALKLARQELARRGGVSGKPKRKDKASARKNPAGKRSQAETTDCYVELWREANFQGESLKICGPAEYPTLRFGGDDWGDEVGSLKVGPGAFVLAYQDCNFENRMVAFGPNEVVADLKQLAFDDEMESLRVIDSLKIFDRPPL